jgi:hypothetical protein
MKKLFETAVKDYLCEYHVYAFELLLWELEKQNSCCLENLEISIWLIAAN